MADFLKISLIIVSSFGVVAICSYLMELRRYIKYLEKKIEDYRSKEIEKAQL